MTMLQIARPSMIPDFWEMLAIAIPIAFVVFSIGVIAYAVYEYHTRGRRKPMGRVGLEFHQPQCRKRARRP